MSSYDEKKTFAHNILNSHITVSGEVQDASISYPESDNSARSVGDQYATNKVWSQEQINTEMLKLDIWKQKWSYIVPWFASFILIAMFGYLGVTTKDKEVKPWALAITGTIIAAGAQLIASGQVAKEAAKEAIEKLSNSVTQPKN